MAKGSQASFEDYPHVCAGCGERVRITRDTCWFEAFPDGTKRSWHWNCRPKVAA